MNIEAGIGHNNPPAYDLAKLEELNNDVAAHIEASNAWLKTEVQNDDLAEKLTDQIDGLRKLHKRADALRIEQKKPHDDAAAEVQKAFLPILDRLKKAGELLKPKLATYAAEKKRKADEEKRLKDEAAAKARAEAEAAAKAAEQAGDIDAMIEAEAKAAEAKRLEKDAKRKVSANIASASGAGRTMSLRARKVCTITAINQAFVALRDEPEVAELFVKLANRRANAAGFEGSIPGFIIDEVESIA